MNPNSGEHSLKKKNDLVSVLINVIIVLESNRESRAIIVPVFAFYILPSVSLHCH